MSGFIFKIDETKLKFLRNQYGDLSLQECILLAQQAEGYLEHMPVTDPAWQHFTGEKATWWKFAWLLSCEAGTFCPTDPHVKYHMFLMSFPKRQPNLGNSEFRDWLRAQESEDVTVEFSCWLPIYLRDNEITSYAQAIYQKQVGIDDRLVNTEILEVTNEQ